MHHASVGRSRLNLLMDVTFDCLIICRVGTVYGTSGQKKVKYKIDQDKKYRTMRIRTRWSIVQDRLGHEEVYRTRWIRTRRSIVQDGVGQEGV